MTQAFVVKAIAEGCPVEGVFNELESGRARIGWSYDDKLDLRKIRTKIRTRPITDLDEHERAAKRCLGFLTRVNDGNYLLYPHQPERGQFAVAQVTGAYDYDDGGLGGDFRSFRPCKLVASRPIYDEIVPSKLRHRLGRPGRFSEVHDVVPLQNFLQLLSEPVRILDDTNRVSIGRIHEGLRKHLPTLIQREFSRADLSRGLCRELFERMGYTHEVQEGPTEAGSDIVVTLGDPLLPDDGVRIGVQVFSYENEVGENALKEKLNQLLRGWKNNDINYGVLLTTGILNDRARVALNFHNERNLSHPVTLVDGESLSNLFLEYFPPAIDSTSEKKNV